MHSQRSGGQAILDWSRQINFTKSPVYKYSNSAHHIHQWHEHILFKPPAAISCAKVQRSVSGKVRQVWVSEYVLMWRVWRVLEERSRWHLDTLTPWRTHREPLHHFLVLSAGVSRLSVWLCLCEVPWHHACLSVCDSMPGGDHRVVGVPTLPLILLVAPDIAYPFFGMSVAIRTSA